MFPFPSAMLQGAASAGGAPASSDVTVTLDTGGGQLARGLAATVHVWRNVNQTTPMDATPTTSNVGNTSKPNPPAITPVTAGAVVVAMGSSGTQANVSGFTSPDLGNFICPTPTTTGTYNGTTGMGSIAWGGSGAVDPAQWSNGSTDSNFAALAATIALRPSGTLQYVGGTTEKNNSSNYTPVISLTGLTGGVESFARSGDIIIVCFGVFATSTFTLGISGYTTIASLYGNDSIDCTMFAGYKLAA